MFAVRAELADPGVPGKLFVNISAVMASLFSPDFASTLAATIHDTGVLPREDYGGQWNPFRTNGTRPPDDNGTSHMSVLDAEGNAVALTMTVNGPFGSALVSRSTGILLVSGAQWLTRIYISSSWRGAAAGAGENGACLFMLRSARAEYSSC